MKDGPKRIDPAEDKRGSTIPRYMLSGQTAPRPIRGSASYNNGKWTDKKSGETIGYAQREGDPIRTKIRQIMASPVGRVIRNSPPIARIRAKPASESNIQAAARMRLRNMKKDKS